MIHVRETIELAAPPDFVWQWLTGDLARLLTVNLFHQKAKLTGEFGGKPGGSAIVWHGLKYGLAFPRQTRLTHWEAPRPIGWVEVDRRFPRQTFPHSQQFRVESTPDGGTLLVNELRGSFNLPELGRLQLGRRFDHLLQEGLVRPVVRRECRTLQRAIEAAYQSPITTINLKELGN